MERSQAKNHQADMPERISEAIFLICYMNVQWFLATTAS